MTLAKICGQRWPRLMPPTWAAAYCGMTLTQFREIPELVGLVKMLHGRELIDIGELDQAIDNLKGAQA